MKQSEAEMRRIDEHDRKVFEQWKAYLDELDVKDAEKEEAKKRYEEYCQRIKDGIAAGDYSVLGTSKAYPEESEQLPFDLR